MIPDKRTTPSFTGQRSITLANSRMTGWVYYHNGFIHAKIVVDGRIASVGRDMDYQVSN